MERELKIWDEEKTEKKPEPLVFWLEKHGLGRLYLKVAVESKKKTEPWNLLSFRLDGTISLDADVPREFGFQLDTSDRIVVLKD